MMRFLTQEFHTERFLWCGLTIILAVLLFVLLLKNVSYRSKLISTQHHEKQLIKDFERMKNSLKLSGILLPSQIKLYGWHIERLKRKGLQDPIKDIITDLMKHNELIPYKGTLGGTMGFYHENNIHILSPKWVFASFENGHIGGHMLLEYQVSNEGEISWRVIDSYLE